MEKSYDILNNHPVNLKRAAEGKRKANSLWYWGAGTKPSIGSFEAKTGLKGAMIRALSNLLALSARKWKSDVQRWVFLIKHSVCSCHS